MIYLGILLYYIFSLVFVFVSMAQFPPRSGRERDGGEYIIAIGFCWLIAPFCVLDWVNYYRHKEAK